MLISEQELEISSLCKDNNYLENLLYSSENELDDLKNRIGILEEEVRSLENSVNRIKVFKTKAESSLQDGIYFLESMEQFF